MSPPPWDKPNPLTGAAAGEPRPQTRRPGAHDPAVLLVGSGETMLDGIQAALTQRHVFSHTVSTDAAAECVSAAAPDLVLLLGDAADDGGNHTLRELSQSPMTSVVPVALLADDAALDERLRAFRHGATAVIPKSASIHAIADQIEQLVREIPEREGAQLGNIGEATLRELVDALSSELRTGILTVRGETGSEEDAVRLVLGGGAPLAEAIDDFVGRLRSHVVHAEPLHYEFDEHAGGTLQLFNRDSLFDDDFELAKVEGLRAIVADANASRADAVAQELRAHGASVVITSFDPTEVQFARLRQLDPAIVLFGDKDLEGPGYHLLRRMRRDTRLRWAALLLVDWDEIWSDAPGSTPSVERLLSMVAELDAPERSIRDRAGRDDAFDVRLESTGPSRLVRAIANCDETLRATVYNPRVFLQVDISEGLVASASGYAHENPDQLFDGTTALSALMVVSSGRVRVERIDHVGTPNVMQTVDVALNVADAEPAPIAPSIPSASGPPSEPVSAAPSGPRKRSAFPWVLLVIGIIAFTGVAGAAIYVLGTSKPEVVVKKVTPTASPSGATAAPSTPPSAAPATSVASPEETPPAAETEDAGAEETPTGGAYVVETQNDVPPCEEVAGKLSSIDPLKAEKDSKIAVYNARQRLVSGRLESAHVSYCRAALLDPKNSAATLGLVRVLILMRDGKGAALWAKKAVENSPKSEHALGLFGDSLVRTGDVDGARSAWLESAAIARDDLASVRKLAQHYSTVGAGARKRGESERAERFFRRAAYLDEKNAYAPAGVARALLRLKDPKPAVAWAKRAIELDEMNGDHHVTLGDALVMNGDDEAAITAFERAKVLSPLSSVPRRRLRQLRPE